MVSLHRFKTNKHKKIMTKKTIIIEDVLFPLNGKLITNGDDVSAQIVDAELDVIECEFDGESCVILNTNNLLYVTLTQENLSTLKKLISKADKYLEKYYDENKN